MTEGGGTMTSPELDVDAVLRDPAIRIVVCCGSGGVGKTTTSAALALRAAEHGRRVVVLTIDPARRLAQALGLAHLDNHPRMVAGATGSDKDGNGGELHAMQLDMKRTFDEVVLAHTTEEKARQIFANPFYQSLSSSFAGTQEYMAMEKLGQLRARGDWDLVVVDTPPSRSALDFLDAPQRLGNFLDGRMIRLLAAPAKAGGRASLRVVSVGFSLFARAVTRIIGTQVITDIAAFVASLETMFGGFRERAQITYDLLRRPGTAFLVVSTPEPDALREASYFVERLSAEEMPLAGLVLNRVHVSAVPQLSAQRAEAAAEQLEEGGVHPLTAAVLRLHADRMALAARETRLRQRFSSAHPDVAVAQIPAMASDVHDLAGLRQIGTALARPTGTGQRAHA